MFQGGAGRGIEQSYDFVAMISPTPTLKKCKQTGCKAEGQVYFVTCFDRLRGGRMILQMIKQEWQFTFRMYTCQRIEPCQIKCMQ